MKAKTLIFFIGIILVPSVIVKAQKIYYTTAETYAVHDSIQKSR